MAQVFRARANAIARLVLLALAVFLVALMAWGYAIVRSPYVTRVGEPIEQPVPFSHAHHVGGLGIDCRYCHTSVENSSFAGLPPTETCMTCHSQLWTNARMLEPVRNSLETGTPLHWTRVNDLPDFVYFNHSIHINKGVGCVTCHGRVDRMPLMQRAQTLHMSWCISCHRAPERFLRPQEHVFDMNWQPSTDQIELGRRLLQDYRIDTGHLTNCYTCHR